MPVARIQLPDGRVARVEVPEGTTPAQAEAFARRESSRQSVKAKPKPEPRNAMKVAGDSARNVLGEVAKGLFALPDLVAEGGNMVQRGLTMGAATVGEPVLRGIGATGAADALAGAGDDAQAGRGAYKFTGMGDIIEQGMPAERADPGVSFGAQLLGGALLPIPVGKGVARPSAPKIGARPSVSPAKLAGQEVVREGQRAGVRVMTSDVRPPKTFIGKGMQAIGEKVPLLGTGGQRAAQQAERVESVRNLAREYGAAVGDDMTAPAIDDVMADFAKTRGAEVSRWAKTKASVIEGTQGAVPATNTARALDAKIAEFSKIDTPAARTLVSKLQGWKESLMVPGRTEQTGLLDAAGKPIVRTIAPEGKDLHTIDLIRAEMGEAFKDPSLASIKSAGEKALQSIYGPMKTDMGAFIKANGGPGKLAQWNRANVVLSGMADELGVSTLRNVLRSGKGTPEDVAKLLFSNKPSLVRRLYNNMSGDGRVRAQAALLQRAIEKSGGMEATSAEKFLTQVQSLGKSIGIFFPEPDMARIEGLTRVLNATRRGAQAGVMTNSGQQSVPFLVGGAAVTHPWLVGGGALLTRAYESAPVRDALLKLARMPKGSKQEAVMLDRAGLAISSVIAANAPKITDAANVNTLASVAAKPDHEQEQQAPLGP